MILIALAAAVLGSSQAAEPTLARVAHHTVDMCLPIQDTAPPSMTTSPRVRDAGQVLLTITPRRCDVHADDWSGDDGEILNLLLEAMAAETDGEWEAEETRAERVNERGPALWSRFVRYGADGVVTGSITLIEPASGRRGFFELTYIGPEANPAPSAPLP